MVMAFRPFLLVLVAVAALSVCARALASQAARSAAPSFQVDPTWPKLPKQWILGQVSGVAVDARDHVWVLQRPWSLNSDEIAKDPDAECCTAPPPVMEFDSSGNYLQGWGGKPADGSYEWPEDEHGIHVDHKGNVWVSSAGGPRMGEGKENFLVKFTSTGKFLLQIGRRAMSKGSLDTANLNNAADMWVHPPTNEVFVADGYRNRRVIVFDADSGAFKRMWGAYGNTLMIGRPRPLSARVPARHSSTPCMGSRCRTTAWSTSTIGSTTVCRCLRSMAPSRTRSSSSERRSCWGRRSTPRSRPIASNAGCIWPTPATAASTSSIARAWRQWALSAALAAMRDSSSSCTTLPPTRAATCMSAKSATAGECRSSCCSRDSR